MITDSRRGEAHDAVKQLKRHALSLDLIITTTHATLMLDPDDDTGYLDGVAP
jgi:hypothetical protein